MNLRNFIKIHSVQFTTFTRQDVKMKMICCWCDECILSRMKMLAN